MYFWNIKSRSNIIYNRKQKKIYKEFLENTTKLYQ